jgi:ABC-type spermidine/putrescine transport system permease subunit I
MATEDGTPTDEFESTKGRSGAAGRTASVIEPLLRHDRLRYYLQLLPAALMLGAFMFLPIVAIVVLSFALPSPFGIRLGFEVGNYLSFFTTYRFMRFVDTVLAGLLQVAIAFVVGFPLAYYTGVRMRGSKYTFPILLLFTIPFITNYIMRTLSWIAFLGREGVFNTVLVSAGVVGAPIEWMLYSDFAVHVSLIASYVPYLLFPTWLAMNRIDDDVLRASGDLGASPLQTFRYVVVPLAIRLRRSAEHPAARWFSRNSGKVNLSIFFTLVIILGTVAPPIMMMEFSPSFADNGGEPFGGELVCEDGEAVITCQVNEPEGFDRIEITTGGETIRTVDGPPFEFELQRENIRDTRTGREFTVLYYNDGEIANRQIHRI